MKDLGLTTFCLGLQIEYLYNGILLHQSSYIHKILKHFSMDQAHSIRTPMVLRSLDCSRDPFRPRSSYELSLEPHILTWLLLVHLCTWPIVRIGTFCSLSICWLGIVTILPGDTGLELSKFSDIYEALKIWVFSLPIVLCTVNWLVILTPGSYLTLMLADHNMLCFPWWHNNILVIDKANIRCNIFKSCWDIGITRSMVTTLNQAYWKLLRFYGPLIANNYLWR